MVSKKFLYFIGDAFSRELLDLIKSIEHIEFVPIETFNKSMLADIRGILYTPSLNFKEKALLEALPQEIKRIALLDLFHFDFKDYIKSFKALPPDIVFTPCEIELSSYEIISIPSFIQAIYSKQNLTDAPLLNKQDICFVSQPLLEERSLSFTQHDLIRRLKKVMSECTPKKKLVVKPHPREDLNLHCDYELFQGNPNDVLTSFHFFTGFNSALLYAAEGLGKSVYRFSSLEEITTEALLRYLAQKSHSTSKTTLDPIRLLADKLHSLS